uniref:Uncharacterized protein n=2 Tax=Clytia hemisphaerica TaxID=252671 RepID=A0A7M5X370_9CNID
MDNIFMEIASKVDSALDAKLDQLHQNNKDLFLCSKMERFRADEALRQNDNLSCEVELLERVFSESRANHQDEQSHLAMKYGAYVQRLTDQLDSQQQRMGIAENQLKASLANENALRKVIKEQELIIQSDVSRKKLKFLENENNELIVELKNLKDSFDDKEMDWKQHYSECPKMIKNIMEKYSQLKKESQDSRQGYEKLIDALTKDCQRLRDENRGHLKALKTQKSELANTKKTMQSEIDTMKTKVSKYKLKYKELSGSLEKKEKIIQQLTKDLDAFKTECINQKSNLEKQDESLTSKTKECNKLRDSKKTWQKKSESYKGKYKLAKDELEKYQKENERQSFELNCLSREQQRAEPMKSTPVWNQCNNATIDHHTQIVDDGNKNPVNTEGKIHTKDTQNIDHKENDFMNSQARTDENAPNSVNNSNIDKSTSAGNNEDEVHHIQQYEEMPFTETTEDSEKFSYEDNVDSHSPSDINSSNKTTNSKPEVNGNISTGGDRESLNTSNCVEIQSNDVPPIRNHSVSSIGVPVLAANDDGEESSPGDFMSNSNANSFFAGQNEESDEISGSVSDCQEITDFPLKSDVQHPYDEIVDDDFFASNNINLLLTNTNFVENDDEFSATESSPGDSLDSMGSDEMARALGCASPTQTSRTDEEIMIHEEELFMQDYVNKIKLVNSLVIETSEDSEASGVTTESSMNTDDLQGRIAAKLNTISNRIQDQSLTKGIPVVSQQQRDKPEADHSLSSNDSREALDFSPMHQAGFSLFDQLKMIRKSPPLKNSFQENDETSNSRDYHSQATNSSPLPKENIGHLPLSIRNKSPPPLKQSLNTGLRQQSTRQNSGLSQQMQHSKSIVPSQVLKKRNIAKEDSVVNTQPFSQRLNVKVKQHNPPKEQSILRTFSTPIAGSFKDRVDFEDMKQTKQIKVNK